MESEVKIRLSAFLILLQQTPGGVETDLEYPGNLFGVSTVHICLSDGPHMEEFAVWGGKNGFMSHYWFVNCPKTQRYNIIWDI